jgi:hypothetical protein
MAFEAGVGFDVDEGWNTLVPQGFLSEDFAFWNRYVVQKLLVTALLATSHHKQLADKVQKCHRRFRHRKCENGHRWVTPSKYQVESCGVRLCPHCAHSRGVEKAQAIQKFCVGREGLRYAVFAERNSKNLAKGIKSLYEAWNSLRRSVRWKGKVVGSIAVLEVTYNKKKRTWHPHLNVLFEGEYFPFEELRQCWRNATKGKGQTAFIRAADFSTAYELIKYTLKVAEVKEAPVGKTYELLLDDPLALDEFLSVIYGIRTIRTYGTFRSMNVEDDATEVEEVKSESEQEERCPDCGSTHCQDVGPVHPRQQLRFDFEKKVLRFDGEIIPFMQPIADLPKVSTPAERVIAREMAQRTRSYERAIARKFAA